MPFDNLDGSSPAFGLDRKHTGRADNDMVDMVSPSLKIIEHVIGIRKRCENARDALLTSCATEETFYAAKTLLPVRQNRNERCDEEDTEQPCTGADHKRCKKGSKHHK